MAAVAAAAAGGKRVTSLCAYREGDAVRFAIVLAPAVGASGELALVVAASRLEPTVARAAEGGFEPALLALADSPRGMLAAAIPRSIEGATLAIARGPLPFRNADGDLFFQGAPRPHDEGHVASLAIAGSALDDEGGGLVAAYVWAPRRALRVAWGVHLDPEDVTTWAGSAVSHVLGGAGSPVTLALVSGPAGAYFTASLWHGVRRAPWPTDEDRPAPIDLAVGPSPCSKQ